MLPLVALGLVVASSTQAEYVWEEWLAARLMVRYERIEARHYCRKVRFERSTHSSHLRMHWEASSETPSALVEAGALRWMGLPRSAASWFPSLMVAASWELPAPLALV